MAVTGKRSPKWSQRDRKKRFVCWWLFCFTFVVTAHICSCFPSNRCSAQWVCPMTHPRSFLLIGRKPNQSERDSLWKYLKHVFIMCINSTNTLFVWYVALFCQVPLRFESSSCRFCFCFFNSLNLNQQPKLNLDSAPDKWNKTRNHSSSRSLLCFYFLIFLKKRMKLLIYKKESFCLKTRQSYRLWTFLY